MRDRCCNILPNLLAVGNFWAISNYSNYKVHLYSPTHTQKNLTDKIQGANYSTSSIYWLCYFSYCFSFSYNESVWRFFPLQRRDLQTLLQSRFQMENTFSQTPWVSKTYSFTLVSASYELSKTLFPSLEPNSFIVTVTFQCKIIVASFFNIWEFQKSLERAIDLWLFNPLQHLL